MPPEPHYAVKSMLAGKVAVGCAVAAAGAGAAAGTGTVAVDVVCAVVVGWAVSMLVAIFATGLGGGTSGACNLKQQS